jgi:hypothetical protein
MAALPLQKLAVVRPWAAEGGSFMTRPSPIHLFRTANGVL